MNNQNLERLHNLTREQLAGAVEEFIDMTKTGDGVPFPNEEKWRALPAQIRAGTASLPFPTTLLADPAAWLQKSAKATI